MTHATVRSQPGTFAKLAFATLAALALALALPARAATVPYGPTTFVTNTSRFDFTNNALTSGYLGFAVQSNQLEILFDSSNAISDVPSISLWVPHATTGSSQAGIAPTYSTLPIYSTTVYPTLSNLGDVQLATWGNQIDAMTVTHGSTTLQKAAFGYVSTFEGLGFTSKEIQSVGSTLAVYRFDDGALHLRLVLHQDGANVTATLQGLTAAAASM